MLLAAATPAESLDRHLAAHAAELGSAPPGESDTWLTRAELLADDAREVCALFDRLRTEGVPPQTSATFVAAFIGAPLAGAVGFVVAGTSGGVVLNGDRTRWRLHRDRYVDRVDLSGASMLVGSDHPWVGQPAVEVVIDEEERLERTVASLVATVEPLIDACHALTRVGRVGLWNQVADAFGLSVVYQQAIPAREDVVELLQRALRMPAAPWRARPHLGIIEGSFGTAYTGQKGGCCLAYLRDDQYCSTCPLRDPAESLSLQLAHFERTRPAIGK